MGKSAFEWIIDKLNQNIKIKTNIEGSILYIIKENTTVLKVIESNLEFYRLVDVQNILVNTDANFILHTVKEPFINGEVFDFLEHKKIILGGFGDLMRVAERDKNFPYYPPDVDFIMRGLRQHTKVANIRRLDNKRYELSRNGLETVIIIALNDYDLGIESLRVAMDEFEKFDAVLKSNPNGGISDEARSLAETLNLRIFTWGELLGKLNLVWTWKK